MMKRFFFFSACIIAVLSYCSACKNNNPKEEIPGEPPLLGFYTEDFRVDSLCVKSGETFSTMLGRLGMSNADAYRLTQVCDTVFDVRKLRAGNTFQAYFSKDSLSRLEYIVYQNTRIRSTIFKCADSLSVWTYDKPVTRERRFADVTINTSLWNDMIASGASPALIVELADIYQWSVNFFGLQQGDRFRVIYSQTVCDDEVIAIDTVHFSLFNSGKHEVPAVLFDIGKGRTFWGKDGESLKKMFLKAPLKYNRVSSRFSYARRHPVSGKVKPHLAVDYAAPAGTPVYSIGEGKVTKSGWDSSGGGNRVKIKHMQGYESCYMHLSRIAKGIRAGSIVHQGDLIGYVGATGTATGPHLDFRVWQNGKALDPLKLNSPSAEPLSKKYLDSFNALYESYMSEVDSLCVNLQQ